MAEVRFTLILITDIQKEIIIPSLISITDSPPGITESSEIICINPKEPQILPPVKVESQVKPTPAVVEKVLIKDNEEFKPAVILTKLAPKEPQMLPPVTQRPPVKKAFGENQSISPHRQSLIDDSDNDSLPEVSSNLRSRTSKAYESEASHPFSIQLS